MGATIDITIESLKKIVVETNVNNSGNERETLEGKSICRECILKIERNKKSREKVNM